MLDDPKKWRSVFSAIDGDTMQVAWQVDVSGNLDNNDADYKGKYVASTCYNAEEGITVADMTASDKDHIVVFSLCSHREGREGRQVPGDQRRQGS